MVEGELDHLRRELLLRIAIQNGTIAGAVLATALLLAALAAAPSGAGVVAVGTVAATGGFLLQWCHCGVRIANIKAYMMEHGSAADTAWEAWLPAHRPRTLLGSRWLISTKGVFLGLQIAALACARATGELAAPVGLLALLGIAGSAAFLFTNPKE